MSNYSIIKEAIEKKQSITCNYDGYVRYASPHVLGSKNGNLQTLVYQYGGETSSGSITDPNSNSNWKCFKLDKITSLVTNSDEFHTADNHSRPQTCVDDIATEVHY